MRDTLQSKMQNARLAKLLFRKTDPLSFAFIPNLNSGMSKLKRSTWNKLKEPEVIYYPF
jgi:hypothetical protein